MKPAPFQYHRPDSAERAVALLAEFGDGAKLLSGGQSLTPMLALRLAVFDHLVDIGALDELRGIERRGDTIWIGANTTHAAIEHSPVIAECAPLLARAARHIGHFQIRNRGTFGGSLAHADPAAEWPAVALALDAELHALSPRGARTIAARDFFQGTWSTALADDEMLVGATIPISTGRGGCAVAELTRRHGDFAIAGAVVALEVAGDNTLQRCAIALLGMGSVPVRATAAEALARATTAEMLDADTIGRAAVEGLRSVPSDLHGSAHYRRRVAAVMVSRALTSAIEEAHNA